MDSILFGIWLRPKGGFQFSGDGVCEALGGFGQRGGPNFGEVKSRGLAVQTGGSAPEALPVETLFDP